MRLWFSKNGCWIIKNPEIKLWFKTSLDKSYDKLLSKDIFSIILLFNFLSDHLFPETDIM